MLLVSSVSFAYGQKTAEADDNRAGAKSTLKDDVKAGSNAGARPDGVARAAAPTAAPKAKLENHEAGKVAAVDADIKGNKGSFFSRLFGRNADAKTEDDDPK